MSNTLYRHLRPFLALLLLCTAISFQSCGDNGVTNYHDRLIGDWQLSNAGDLQPFYNSQPYSLKSAIMSFKKDGTLETRILKSGSDKTWKVETGTWSVTQSPNTESLVQNESLTIKADDTPFDDFLYISFIDERTFYIAINELEYEFVKL